MKTKILLFISSLFQIFTPVYAEQAGWDEEEIVKITTQLESEEYSEISSALHKVVSTFKNIPVEDLNRVEPLIYKLLDSNIPVPDTHKPPVLNVKSLPVNLKAGITLGRITGYEKNSPLPRDENQLILFKKWYENNHLKNLESQIRRDDRSNKRGKRVERIDSEHKTDEYRFNDIDEVSKDGDVSKKLIEEKIEQKKSPSRLPWIIAGVLLLGILLLLFKVIKGKSKS